MNTQNTTHYHDAEGMVFSALQFTPGPGSFTTSSDEYKRIVVCVNACRGMTNPAAEITKLRADRETYLTALEIQLEELNRVCTSNTELLGVLKDLVQQIQRDGHISIVRAMRAINNAKK